MHLPAHQIRNHLFVSGAEAEIPGVPVLEAQQFLAVNMPAAGLLPEFSGLHRGQEHLLGAGPVHLLAHDVFDFPEYSQSQRQIIINAGGELADHAGPEKQAVGDGLGLGRVFFERRNEQAGKQHNFS